MSTILDRIVATRRERLEALREQYTQAQLFSAIKEQPPRPRRSLAAALKRADKGFILECKKASPSKGLIREHFDPVDIATTYQPYAAAISVLTEPDYFAGDFAYLQAVSRQVQIPVLCKDFIVDPLQVYLARYFGADAILLMLSLLDDDTYRNLAELATKLDLEILTEVSNEDEMQRANSLDAAIIGINHRNLHDMSVDLKRSEQLAAHAPEGALLVAESGIVNNAQVRDIGRFVDGFLVGSHLTAQADIDAACRALIYGKHKICGLTSAADALMAKSAGATFGGLIFADQSPRQIDLKTAQTIITQVPGLAYVAVVTDSNAAALVKLAHTLKLHALQLHGQQSAETVKYLAQMLPLSCELWYALSVDGPVELPDLPVHKFVLDHGKGGTGERFNWDFIPPQQRERCLLAGGLSADNIHSAVAQGLAGLDINSGVERSPGVKDAAKLNLTFSRLAAYYRDSHAAFTKETSA